MYFVYWSITEINSVMLDESTWPSVCLKLSFCVCAKRVGGQLPLQCSLVRIGLTVKTEKILFRQCRRIRTASWGSKVRESKLRDQQAVSIVCLQQNTNQHVLLSPSSSVSPLFCQFLSLFVSFHLHFLYISVWVFLLGSLPLVVTLTQVFQIWCSV